jgi:hypothetical protein
MMAAISAGLSHTKINASEESRMAAPQNFKNHGRFDPLFHFFIAPLCLLNVVVVFIWHLHHRYTNAHSGPWAVLMSVVLLVIVVKFRTYALRNQDRIIRLEERLRLAALLSPSELTEVSSLTTRQLIGLRFASDPELPDLARRAVRENLTEKQIKEAIVSWRPDNERV